MLDDKEVLEWLYKIIPQEKKDMAQHIHSVYVLEMKANPFTCYAQVETWVRDTLRRADCPADKTIHLI